jgi:hypothetical protein
VIDPKLIDVFDVQGGYVDGEEDTPDGLFSACGSAARKFPASMLVPRDERKDMARENYRLKTWGINYLDRFTHQGNSHECSAHAVTRSIEAARNRHRGIIYPDGPRKDFRYTDSSKGSVWLSPLSLYLESNPSQWGGSNIVRNVNIAQRRGPLPDRVQPAEYGFRHMLQGSAGGRNSSNQSIGPWVSLRNLPQGFEETSKHFRPLEIFIIENEDEGISALLHGGVIAYGRRGHAVPVARWDHGQDVYAYVDSYDRVLYDSAATFRSACQGAVCVWTTEQPSDWLKPAG